MQDSITEERFLPQIDIRATDGQTLSHLKQNLLCWREQTEQLAIRWKSSGKPKDLEAWVRLVCAMPIRTFHDKCRHE